MQEAQVGRLHEIIPEDIDGVFIAIIPVHVDRRFEVFITHLDVHIIRLSRQAESLHRCPREGKLL